MSVTIDHAALERHGLTSEEQLAVFAYMQRSMAVRAYEVKQHIAVRAGEATWRRRGGGCREVYGNIMDRSLERRGRGSRARRRESVGVGDDVGSGNRADEDVVLTWKMRARSAERETDERTRARATERHRMGRLNRSGKAF